MNVLNERDGMDRKRYEGQRAELSGFCALEEDWWNLLKRVTETSECLWFFNRDNRKDGYWYELWHMQPLVILAEICGVAISVLEQEFLHLAGTNGQEYLYAGLKEKVDRWKSNLQKSYWKSSLGREAAGQDYRVTMDLHDELHRFQAGQNESLQIAFYRLLHIISDIQSEREKWYERIKEDGNMDPALAVVTVFLQNYAGIVKRFNKRWEDFPMFYYEQILRENALPPLAEHTWLALFPDAGVDKVRISAGAGFIAAGQEAVCYRMAEDVEVNAIQLAKVLTVFPEQSGERFPAARLGFVTSLKRKEIPLLIQGDSQPLFDNEDENAEFIFPGLLIESVMLLLREGERRVSLRFYLTDESAGYFDRLIDRLSWPGSSVDEVICKVLKDAFYIKVSTEGGWNGHDSRLVYEKAGRCLLLTFCLPDSFPPLCACREDQHGMTTCMPVLQILTNPDAWLYSYSWARKVFFEHIHIGVTVKGVRSLKIYNEAGEQDTSTSFYPFGMRGEKGAWMVFGNYEMAVKPVVRTELCCKWRQLPDNENGFWGHYRGYGSDIDNYSFRVRTEWLTAKKWKTDEERLLFAASANNSRIEGESCISYFPDKEIPVFTLEEERYEYGKVSDGFMRIVLSSPDMGFGNAVYRQLFSDVMIYNSRHKSLRPLPMEPVAPLLDEVVLNYEAEYEYFPETGIPNPGFCLYRAHPLSVSGISPVKEYRAISIVEGPEDEANLLLGFYQAEGIDRIRLYIDLDPEKDGYVEETLAGCLPEADATDVAWFMNNGTCWEPVGGVEGFRDTTGHFMRSGLIELILPRPVGKEWLDKEGIFWITAAIKGKISGTRAVRGFYVNAAEVVADGETALKLPAGSELQPENSLPGIASAVQILSGYGGRPAEDRPKRDLRLANGIFHRNRAVTPADFERIALEHFPELEKVKCLPVTEGDPDCLVRLVVMQSRSGGRLPGCSWALLQDIHALLCGYMSSFVRLLVINPIYEEITVRCRIKMYEGVSVSSALQRLDKKLKGIISPWLDKGGMPVLGYVFSLQELWNAVAGDESVADLSGLAVLHVMLEDSKVYELKEYAGDTVQEVYVKASSPWCVTVPSSRHQIIWDADGEWTEEAGVGMLKIGNTFIIK